MLRPVPCSALSAPSYLLDDHGDDIVHEVAVAVDLGRGVEALGEDEVQVAVFGVAEDDGVVVAVLGRRERAGPWRPRRGGRTGSGDVFDERGGAGGAHGADRGEHAFADLPELGLLDRDRW